MKNSVTLPRFTRASDIRSLDECQARWFWEKVFADELDEAGYFILGTALHKGFEYVATEDVSLEAAIGVATQLMDERLYDAKMTGTATRWTKRRTEKTWPKDIIRILTKWWSDVHPSSDTRMPVYDEYKWPFEAEHVIDESFLEWPDRQCRLHTTLDALFERKDESNIAIVDWKTGATAKAKDIQLWTYETGRRMEGELKPIHSWFHHADHSKIQIPFRHPGDEYIKDWISETQYRKERESFLATSDWWCSYCRVKDKCVVFREDAPSIEDIMITFEDDPKEYYGIQ
jgi:hypothetical protein